MDGFNLLLHVLCLSWQLSANFAFLQELDSFLEKSSTSFSLPHSELIRYIMSRCTAAFWSLHLVRTSPTPWSIKVASLLSIFLGHHYLGPWFSKRWKDVIFYQGFFEALVVQHLVLNKPTSLGPATISFALLRTLIWKYVSDHLKGSLKANSKAIILALVAIITAGAASKEPLKRTVSVGLYGWVLALLTDCKGTYFWSAGMMATLAQGVAHRISGEDGTLEVLQQDISDQTSYEFSHVTFFPNLLFQACQAHIRSLSK
eukprot:TRINITY_DN114080_c0_g1_i1.p1 TRINITY_DN114080_c0_g1~~TRINITY_DN114080_c0_g1_i1.p1  ORF type:complete len:259 (+),score=30.54 TRINITY_DN114080_c0_g1_i1:2-778(+)